MMVCGTVKIFYEAHGFGIVTPDSGNYEIVVQLSLLERLGLAVPRQGQRVKCKIEADRHGRASASEVSLL